jgi:metal-responsive CopG/Arc/MetJ family transcriptional regulator
MKTAISIESSLLEEADRTATKLGVSRSRLVSLALAEYLKQQRNEDITRQLNRVYAHSSEPRLDLKPKFRATIKDGW